MKSPCTFLLAMALLQAGCAYRPATIAPQPADHMRDIASSRFAVIPDWRSVEASPFAEISESGVSNPVLDPRTIDHDLPGASFAADPFLFREDGVWYLFFEAAVREDRYFETSRGGKSTETTPIRWGRIALATSRNGTHWDYAGIVLDEVYPLDDPRGSVHHSYPLVFKVEGRHYMVTEAYMQRQIRFYEARDFPHDWERVYTITKCTSDHSTRVTPGQCIETDNPAIGYLDPSIFRYDGRWWMFGGAGSKCYLYYSDDLLSGWTEHPHSPIVSDDPRDEHYHDDAAQRARPGGRPLVFDHGRIVRLAQGEHIREEDGARIWRLRAFEVTLSTTEYAETEITDGASFCGGEAVFCESGSGWNAYGMHHFDAWWTGDHWLIATDGYLRGASEIAVGIYRSPPPARAPREPFLEREREIRIDVR